MRRIKRGKDVRNRERPYFVRWADAIDPDTGRTHWTQRSFRYKIDADSFAAEKRVEGPELVEPEPEQPAVTIGQFRRAWFSTVAPTRRPATVDLYRDLFDRLEECFGGSTPLADIKRQVVERFIVSQQPKQRSKTELSAATRNQYRRNLRALFNVAVGWSYLEENPMMGVEDEEMQQLPFHHLTAEQEKALLEQAPTLRVRALYDLLLTTGLRLREALSRTWREIDFEHGSLIVIDRKGTPDLPPFRVKARRRTGQNWRIVPLSVDTLNLLAKLQEQAPEAVPYVFLDERRYRQVLAKWQAIGMKDRLWNNRWLTSNTLRNFRLHCRKAGIKPDGKLSLHSLRKNTAQNMADAGIPLRVMQEILGHSKADTLLEYYQQVEDVHAQLVRDLMHRRRSGAKNQANGDPNRYVSGTYEAVESKVEE